MKKAIIAVSVGLVILLLAGLALALFYLGPLVKKGVETVGPVVTQVDVRLDSAQVGLLSGRGTLKGLVVGNPPGYKSETALRLGEVSVALEPRSVFGDKLHLQSVAIVAPEITLEGGLKENNLTRIMANVQAFSGGASTNQAAPATQRKIQLDSLVVRGARVRADLNVPGVPALNLTLPDIELSNLGQGPEGITAGELTRVLLGQITTKTLAAVTEQAANLGKAVVEGATGAAKAAADTATKTVTDAAGKSVGEAADKALKGVGDLFKKKN
jgi:uncharacterized protein involved in outer membrane biogenesis